ncbi:hypothetical protein BGZ94_005240 [Podila epigama]|nr:hypothetical protein BGZ94_005240 [Podila epigama]
MIKSCAGADEHMQCLCQTYKTSIDIMYMGCEDHCTPEWINQIKGLMNMSMEQVCKNVTVSSAGTSVVNSSKKTAIALSVAAMAAQTLL